MAIDALMASTTVQGAAYPTWDFVVTNGQVPMVTGTNGDQQNANVAVFMQTGTIPQLPDKGVNWVGFLTSQIGFGQLDANIRQALQDAQANGYVPNYKTAQSTLTVSVQLGSTG